VLTQFTTAVDDKVESTIIELSSCLELFRSGVQVNAVKALESAATWASQNLSKQ